MAYTEVNMYVSSGKYHIKCPYGMAPKGITVHNTANDASAKNEASYMINNNNKVSFHDVVDDKNVVHCVPHNRNAWHAGDGGSGAGNRYYIGIEICYSKSGGTRFDEAEKNAAKYIAVLLKRHGWGIDKVKRHKDFSGKYCPHRTMDYGWERFLNMVRSEMGNAPVSTPTVEKLAVDGSWGCDTTRSTQKVLGTTVDGIVSNQPTSNKKFLEAASTTSWKFKRVGNKGGSAMVKAVQKLIGATIDGYFGKQSVICLQTFLNRKGYACGIVDGYMGRKTVMAWQRYINSRL